MSAAEQSLTSEMDTVRPVDDVISIRLKHIIQIVGLVMLIVGAPIALNLLCVVPLVALSDQGTDVVIYGVISLTLVLLTVGAGGAALLHADRSLHNKPSKPLRLPSPFLLVAIFIPLLLFGFIVQTIDVGAGLIFPFILVACAILPPLWAVAWMIPQASPPEIAEPALTWRRGLLAFAGGATLSVLIAIVLEILLPVVILALVNSMADIAIDQVQSVLRDLSSRDVAAALTNRSFIYIFVQLTIIAPFAEEIAKPLVLLPLLRRLNKRESFWLGALAGAGFAALENVVYATSGFLIWAGILIVRSLGGALHPLGSGLVAQGWWSILRGEKDANKNWLKRFGIAFAIHAAWNGGSLLVITLGGVRFFGGFLPEIGVLGFSATGMTLAFLILLGGAALWIGRAYGHDKPVLFVEDTPQAEFTLSDRTLAIWALVCLIALVPIGIAGLKLWLR